MSLRIAWEQIPGLLKQIAVGHSEVFGINANRDVFRFDGAGFPPPPVAGNAVQIAVGENDEAWMINGNQDISKFDGAGFGPIPGKLADPSKTEVKQPIGVGSIPGEVWGINASQEVFKFNSSTALFEKIPGRLVWIAVGDSGIWRVWGINASQEIFKSTGANFDLQVPGVLAQIAVGAFEVWGINPEHNVFRFNNTTSLFEQIQGQLTQIALGAPRLRSSSGQFMPHVWGINASDQTFWFDPDTNTLQFIDSPPFVYIAVGGAGVWGLDTSQKIYRATWF